MQCAVQYPAVPLIVVYDKVKISPTLKISAADNYRELWSLDIESMRIFDIQTLA